MTPHKSKFEVESEGFSIVQNCLSQKQVDELNNRLEPLFLDIGRTKGGIRDIFSRSPFMREWCQNSPLWDWVEPIVGIDSVIVNATLFDKAEGRNWKVPFHQDVTIRVKERKEVPCFDTWWEKDGVPHVWPTADVLERMVAVRIQLDDCGLDNGPLRVIPNSHKSGILTAEEIEFWRVKQKEVICTAPLGSIILMRPLLLHASSSAISPTRRRVLHLEFATPNLPIPLEWFDRLSRTR